MSQSPVYQIRSGSMGSFLVPPGHPALTHEVRVYYPRGNARITPALRRDADGYMSIDSVLTDEYAPESVKARVRRMMDSANLVYSELWIRSVYGYFRNSYAPADDPTNRNVSDAYMYRPGCTLCRNPQDDAIHTSVTVPGWHAWSPLPLPPATRHLGYLAVREYFPEHEPRTDLIENPGKGYGSYPCVKCDQRVQYESRKDAFCVVTSGMRWSYNDVCPADEGKHEI